MFLFSLCCYFPLVFVLCFPCHVFLLSSIFLVLLFSSSCDFLFLCLPCLAIFLVLYFLVFFLVLNTPSLFLSLLLFTVHLKASIPAAFSTRGIANVLFNRILNNLFFPTSTKYLRIVCIPSTTCFTSPAITLPYHRAVFNTICGGPPPRRGKPHIQSNTDKSGQVGKGKKTGIPFPGVL